VKVVTIATNKKATSKIGYNGMAVQTP